MRPPEDIDSLGTVARYSVSTWCLDCGSTLSEEEQAERLDVCLECEGLL